ncbi:MAG: TlpA disulfide reductase family protein, partial [Planctomycetota bacterium]
WRLDRWFTSQYFDGGPAPELEAVSHVTKSSFSQPTDSTAALATLPVGAKVRDSLSDEEGCYLVREDGEKREITSQDTQYGDPTYEELRSSEPGRAMPQRFVAFYEQLRGIGQAPPDERDRQLQSLKDYLSTRETRVRHVSLVQSVSRRLLKSPDPESAIRLCREFAEISEIYDRALSPLASELERELRRKGLPGAEIVVTGRTVEGEPFDWSQYRGKVVLIDFWYIGCKPCMEELPHIKRLYEQHHEEGFDVVGINVDESKEQLEAYLADEEIPWTTIYEGQSVEGSNNRRYGVHSWPTAILVDRDGKVVSIEARGDKLEDLLARQFGGEE